MITKFKLFENLDNYLDTIYNRIDKESFDEYVKDHEDEHDTTHEYLESYLDDEFSIQIEEIEGEQLFSFNTYSEDIEELLTGLPILLYHYTSYKYLSSIKKNGLVTGYHKTNPYKNSYSGVYLTTSYNDSVVKDYLYMATKNKSDGLRCYVKTTIDDVHSDCDDEDLSCGRNQFISNDIPPHNIIKYEKVY